MDSLNTARPRPPMARPRPRPAPRVSVLLLLSPTAPPLQNRISIYIYIYICVLIANPVSDGAFLCSILVYLALASAQKRALCEEEVGPRLDLRPGVLKRWGRVVTVARDTVGSNCSMGSCRSSVDERISSNNSN